MVLQLRVVVVEPEVEHEQRIAEALLAQRLGFGHAARIVAQQLGIGVHDVGVRGHGVGREQAAVFQAHAAGASALRFDARHRGVQLDAAADVLEQPGQRLDQRPGAAAREPHAPAPFQCVDQRVDRGGGEGIAAHQQRMEGKGLAQVLVLDEARDHAVDAAPGLQARELRPGLDHVAEGEEGHGAELDVAFLEHRLRIGQEALVAGDVGRVARVDLAVQGLLVVQVVEVAAVFPAQAVEGRDRQHLDVVLHALAGRGEQLLDAGWIGDHRRAGIEHEALVLVDVGAAARLVAFFEQRGLHAAGLQADGQGQAAESGADDHGGFAFVHSEFLI